VLLLPGALATAAFYDDLVAEPRLSDASIEFVATTLPGFGGTSPPEDVSMENYAKLAGRLAADFGCDAVVGHSLGANVALEMVAAGEFAGPVCSSRPASHAGTSPNSRARSTASAASSGIYRLR
jgi:pimeloyl-ACP methyl ester carboxylesterase